MSLSETRLGGNAPGLPVPAPLPSISSALSRRAALFGAVTVAGVTAVAAVPAMAQAGALSPNDTRLVALADAYEALDRRCDEHTAVHRHLTGAAAKAADADFNVLVAGFSPLEEELAQTPADSLAGVLAKARVCQNTTLRDSVEDVSPSIVSDLWRLFGRGALS